MDSLSDDFIAANLKQDDFDSFLRKQLIVLFLALALAFLFSKIF